jgi:hypothetical protein
MKLNFDDDTFVLVVKLGSLIVGLVIMWLVI